MKNIAEMIAKAPSGVLRFQRLEDAELDWVSAAGDPDLLRKQDSKKTDINKL